MRRDRQVFEVGQMAAALAPTNSPQYFVRLRMRRNITRVDRLLIQRFGENEQHLRQVACRLQPIGARTVVPLLVAIQFYPQTQVLDVQIIGVVFLGVVLQQQRTHYRLQCFAVVR